LKVFHLCEHRKRLHKATKSPGKFSVTEIKFASFVAARNHQIQDLAWKHWAKCPLLVLQSLHNFPSPLFVWFRLSHCSC